MKNLTEPRYLPLLEVIGLALCGLIFVFPEVRSRWVIGLVSVLFFYSAFWSTLDLYRRGLLTRNVREVYQAVGQSKVRTRFEQSAFGIVGAIVLVMYL